MPETMLMWVGVGLTAFGCLMLTINAALWYRQRRTLDDLVGVLRMSKAYLRMAEQEVGPAVNRTEAAVTESEKRTSNARHDLRDGMQAVLLSNQVLQKLLEQHTELIRREVAPMVQETRAKVEEIVKSNVTPQPGSLNAKDNPNKA